MSIRVMLVDDHTIVRQGLAAVLRREASIAVVGQAGDGQEALIAVAELEPDVVVMDIAMHELNGIEAAERIRQTYPHIQIVILSMHATSQHIYRALRADVRAYLLKGEAAELVVAAIHDVHRGIYHINEQYTPELVRQRKSVDDNNDLVSPLEQLSGQEREILQLVVEGLSSRAIGERLFLATSTVDTYRSRMMTKLGISDIPSLVKFAVQLGITRVN